MLSILALLAPLALADTLTLDSGATVEGALTRYEPDGECRIAVTQGELAGTALVLPCARLRSFERHLPDFAPVSAVPVQEEVIELGLPVVLDPALQAGAEALPDEPRPVAPLAVESLVVEPLVVEPLPAPSAPTLREPTTTLSW